MTTTPPQLDTPEPQQQKDVARRALEEVCARGDFAKAEQFYDPSFRDHVNSLEFQGLEGVRQSVGMYRAVSPILRSRSTTKWSTETGSHHGGRRAAPTAASAPPSPGSPSATSKTARSLKTGASPTPPDCSNNSDHDAPRCLGSAS